MKIGITGATGFLGGHLVRYLNQRGYQVVGFGRNSTAGLRLESEKIGFVQLDIKFNGEVISKVKDLDLVVHCAALSSAWGPYHNFYQSNVVGTKNILEACRENGIERFIYISSSSVYFDYRDRLGIIESDPVASTPASSYTLSKLEAESYVKESNDVGWIILRPRGIFGIGDPSIFPRVLKIAEKGWFPLVQKGASLIDLTYVDNLVHCIENCICAEKPAWNKIYNVTNGEPIHVFDFFNQLMNGLNMHPRCFYLSRRIAYACGFMLEKMALIFNQEEPLLTRYTAGLLGYSQTLNIEKAKTLLGYTPVISLKEGLDVTVDHLKSSIN